MMMSDQHNTVLLPRIERRIQVIRGLPVMLDVDLAALYGVAICDHLLNLTAPTESKDGTLSALLKGGCDHPGADTIQVMTMKVTKAWVLRSDATRRRAYSCARRRREVSCSGALCCDYVEIGDECGQVGSVRIFVPILNFLSPAIPAH